VHDGLTSEEIRKLNEIDAIRYRKIRDRISTTTLSVVTLSEARPSEEYGRKIDKLVDSLND